MLTHKEYYLACDIGTNAVRILVGRVIETSEHVRVQKQSFMRLPVRLGDDVFCTGVISQKKIEKIIAACQIIQSLCRVYAIEFVRVCATSAVRESRNSEALVSAVKKATGIHIEIIDGDEEARLTQEVVRHAHNSNSSDQLFIDVGGGSTELVRFANHKLVARYSFKLGTVRQLVGKVDSKEWDALDYWLSNNNLIGTKDANTQQTVPPIVIGTGGTINTLTKVTQTYTNEIVLSHIDMFINQAKELNTEQRQLRWDLRADKADVMVIGSQIYSWILHAVNAKKILVPKVGLVDGLVLQAHFDNHMQTA